MKKLSVLALIILIFVSKINSKFRRIDFRRDGRCLNRTTLEETHTKSAIRCGAYCFSRHGCESFHFSNGMCSLLKEAGDLSVLDEPEICGHFTKEATTKKCPERFKQYGTHCYFFNKIGGDIPDSTWHDATLECNEFGAKLVAIETAEEQEHLIETWINIREHSPEFRGEKGLWTDGKMDIGSEQWIWSMEGTHLTYTNWNVTRETPSIPSIEERCLYLDVTDVEKPLQWKHASCKDFAAGFICELAV